MNKRWNHMPSHQPSRSDGVELSSLMAGLLRNKWIIIFCIAVAGIAAFGTLKNIRPSYYSYVEVLLNTRQERVVGVEQVVSDLNVTNSIVAGEIAVLRSNVLIGNVVDELGLVGHPDFDPRLDSGPTYFERLQIRIFGEEPMPEADEVTVSGLSEQDARNIVIWKVRRDLSVFQSGISYVINISMEAHDPEIAAAIANAIAERYIQDQLDAKLAATQRAISWLDNRLFELEGQLRDAEDEVVDFLAQQVLEEGGDKDSVELQLLELNRMFVSARNDRAAADAKLGYVQGLLSTEGLAGALSALETTRLTRLDDELAALERDQAQLTTRLGPRHPEMLELQLAVDDLLRDREVAIRAAVAELEAAVAQAQGRETAIADEIRAAQILQVDLSRSSVRLSQLERSASAMRQVYETFLSRFQETTQQLEFQRADARVISKAEPALAPSRPRNKLILAVALFLGAILGISAALIRSMIDPILTSAAEMEGLIDVPVVGVLPEVGGWWARLSRKNWSWLKKELLKYSRSRYAQNFRLIQSNLIKNEASSSETFLITATEKGAGASTFAQGLARLTASAGSRVAILDINQRQNTKPMNGPRMKTIDFGTNIEPNLVVFELLDFSNGKAALDLLIEEFEYVIIDSPPVTDAPHALALATYVQSVILVSKPHRSRLYSIAYTSDILRQSGAHIAGAVISHSSKTMTLPSRSPEALKPPSKLEWPIHG